MKELLWLIPSLPLVGFILLALFGGRLSPRRIAWVGVGAVGASAFVTVLAAWDFMRTFPAVDHYRQTQWTWVDTAGLTVDVTWNLDALSLVMILVITLIGSLIHIYSTEYMAVSAEAPHTAHHEAQGNGRSADDPQAFRRYFAYMNLFVASMLTLVLADNLLLLYLGWEGVGLCSYLLIGFWYRQPENGVAAQKAFIVTRIGDTALAVGLFVIYSQLGTLSIEDVQAAAASEWPVGSAVAMLVAALILIGAVGKSAQLPLQVWLPDAMAGPTPVSALIHAATMVTAGVYLIARLHGLFLLAPPVHSAVAVIGAVTIVLAACSALVQRDIKRVLAYSTISQIGYMFLALGVGAWSAALFHFVTHACFKALLFLGAGSVIISLNHEQDIFRMGGLRRHLPVTAWTFLIGAAALSGVPLLTAGFYSKDWILWSAWSSPISNTWIWLSGALGTFLTALYSFRLVFRVFCGDMQTIPTYRPGVAITGPLLVLAFLSVVVGWLELPRTIGTQQVFSHFLAGTLPGLESSERRTSVELTEQLSISVLSLLGIGVAFVFFASRLRWTDRVVQSSLGRPLVELWRSGWGFDRFYDRAIVRPWFRLTHRSRDVFDIAYGRLADGASWLHRYLSRTQTGQVRWYAASLAVGALILLGLLVARPS